MNLLFLLGAPILTAIAVLLASTKQQIRWISFVGAAIQLLLAFLLLFAL